MDRRAEMLEEEPLRPHDGLVMQVSRREELKDPIGVLDAFAKHVASQTNAHVLLAGPSTEDKRCLPA